VTLASPTIAQGQLADALTQVRMSRHQPSCCCGLYRSSKGAAFCSVDEWRWSETVDRILETIRRNSF
jgi:hypothetical protein